MRGGAGITETRGGTGIAEAGRGHWNSRNEGGTGIPEIRGALEFPNYTFSNFLIFGFSYFCFELPPCAEPFSGLFFVRAFLAAIASPALASYTKTLTTA